MTMIGVGQGESDARRNDLRILLGPHCSGGHCPVARMSNEYQRIVNSPGHRYQIDPRRHTVAANVDMHLQCRLVTCCLYFHESHL